MCRLWKQHSRCRRQRVGGLLTPPFPAAIGKQGGGFHALGGNLEINHSTIAGNTAVQGGGIYAAGGNVEINHSIIANNTAIGAAGGAGGTGGDAMGGGLFFAGFNMEINHTTFASNLAIGAPAATGRRARRPRLRARLAETVETARAAGCSLLRRM